MSIAHTITLFVKLRNYIEMDSIMSGIYESISLSDSVALNAYLMPCAVKSLSRQWRRTIGLVSSLANKLLPCAWLSSAQRFWGFEITCIRLLLLVSLLSGTIENSFRSKVPAEFKRARIERVKRFTNPSWISGN